METTETVETTAEGSDLRSFLAKRGVAVDPAAMDDRALEELDERYLIARDLDAATVLSKIRDVLARNEASIASGEGVSYQLPSHDLEQHEYDPLLRQLCLRRGKVDSCWPGDPKSSRRATVITAALAIVQQDLLAGFRTTSHLMSYKDVLFKKKKKVVDDILLDICCLLECTRASLNVFEPIKGSVIGPITFIMEDGKEIICSLFGIGGARIFEDVSKITVTSGAEVKFILVVQRKAVFYDFAMKHFLDEFSCVIITGGDGQPDFSTRAFLRKLKDCLSVPVYALVDPDPQGLSILCTYKFGSSKMPFDNAGLTVPDIKWIGVYLSDALDLNDESVLSPLNKEDLLILDGLCANKYVISDELSRVNIHFMMYRGLQSKIEALYHRQYLPSDYIRKAINNQLTGRLEST